MSKNFEDEYKLYIEEIKPDLWSKISAQLPERDQISDREKNEEDVLGAFDSDINNSQIVEFPQSSSDSDKIVKMPFRKRWTKYTGVIAACLCIVLLVPVYFINRERMQENAQANAYESAQNSNQSVSKLSITGGNKGLSKGYANVKASVEAVDGSQATISIVSSDSDLVVLEEQIAVTLSDSVVVESGKSYEMNVRLEMNGSYTIMSVEEIR